MAADPKALENFHKACRSGDSDGVVAYVKQHPQLVDAKDRDGWTGLFHAVSNGKLEVAKILVSNGANVNTVDEDGRPPLFEAVAEGSKEMVQFLLDKGASIAVNLKSGGVLHKCVEWDNADLANLFIQRGADVNARDNSKNTPLILAAAKNKPELVKILLKHGADPNVRNKKDQTALNRLYYKGKSHKIFECLDALVRAGANINEVNENGDTFLHHLATVGELLDTVKMRSLLKAGCDPEIKNANDQTALEVLEEDYEGGDVQAQQIMKGLLTNGPEWVPSGQPPFYVFIQTMSSKPYLISLEKGADSTVLELKQAIHRYEINVLPDQNKLRFKETIHLDNDDAKLRDYGIQNEDAILSILVAHKKF